MKSPSELNFYFPITPIAKGRARVSRYGHVFTPKKTRDFEEEIKTHAKILMLGKPIFDTALNVEVAFVFKRPKSVKIKKRKHPTIKPDCDNLIKSLFDALNGVVWTDDAIVVNVSACKIYEDHGGIKEGIYLDVNILE